MATPFWRRFGIVTLSLLLAGAATPAHADEIWVSPTSQADIGGLGVASNTFWPVTPVGAVRLAWTIPNNLLTPGSAKVAIIPSATAGGPPALHFYICATQDGNSVMADCTGPFVQTFTSASNQLVEVEIGGVLSQHTGTAGLTYLAILAYTTPATSTDHIVGLRFSYTPKTPTGVATLAANTFAGTQTAPNFVGSFTGNGAGLTNLPAPSGVATLGANTFTGNQTAPAFVGDGIGLTNVAKLGANTYTGTQTIDNRNLNLTANGMITKDGVPLLRTEGASIFLGGAGNSYFGLSNIGIGASALSQVTADFFEIADLNIAVGHQAQALNELGNNNVAIGTWALYGNVLGSGNTAVGSNANATYSSVGESFRTAVGDNATARGNFSTALGMDAGTEGFGSNNLYLGSKGGGADSDTIRIGYEGGTDRPAQTRTFMTGVRGVTTNVADAVPVVIDSNGQLGTISSSRRFKEDIRDMADASQRLFNLRPVTFRYTKPYANGSKPIQFGLVAEEVAEAFPELGVRDANGNVETVHYETLNVLLLNELKKEHVEAQQQRQRIDMLEQRLNELMIQRTTTQP